MIRNVLNHSRCSKSLLAAAIVLLSITAQAQQLQFSSPEEAVNALVQAAEKNDVHTLQQILGPGSEEITASGDDIADRSGRQQFVELYHSQHNLQREADGVMSLEIGPDAWPFPVPLVRHNEHWILDGAAGVKEMVYRRIGRNELGAIKVCRGFLDAQKEYAAQGHDGREPGIYATKLFSEPGKHDGLYWQAGEGEPPSPAGDSVAAASEEGYRAMSGGSRQPYHGYYFRMLYAQGSHAPGGAYDYFADGALTQGVALLAWPANYGVSGINTFIVSHDGVIYENDLGENTAGEVDQIESFDPDDSWSPVQEDTGTQASD